jgi:hypothetical protein
VNRKKILVNCLIFCAQLALCSEGLALFSVKSAGQRAVMLELFSSEGCSSCPPADAWLGQLRLDPLLWKRVIPVEFHVDYWNRLGWNDVFSRSQFTQRQSNYANMWGRRNLYTPGFVLNGAEWERDRGDLARKGTTNEKGPLLEVNEIKKRELQIRFSPDPNAANWKANVAILGNGIESKVLSGENKGKNLKHEFVVLSWTELPLEKKTKTFEATIQLPEAKGEKISTSLSLVVWISQNDNQIPIQAVGGDWAR